MCHNEASVCHGVVRSYRLISIEIAADPCIFTTIAKMCLWICVAVEIYHSLILLH